MDERARSTNEDLRHERAGTAPRAVAARPFAVIRAVAVGRVEQHPTVRLQTEPGVLRERRRSVAQAHIAELPVVVTDEVTVWHEHCERFVVVIRDTTDTVDHEAQ